MAVHKLPPYVGVEQDWKRKNYMTIKELIQQKEQIMSEIRAIQQSIEPQLLPMQEALNKLETEITTQATAILNAFKDKDTGTFNLAEDGVKIKVTIGKTIKWDQGILAGIWERIAESGDDPKQYIQPEYKISENAYKGWPNQIKGVFMPARTVTPTKPKFEFELTDCPF
jgi:hypothetical protein